MVATWQARIRQVLLLAHVVPALAGLGATLAAGRSRPLDVEVWAVVSGWTLFLLLAGWRRAGAGSGLAGWVIADALVMAALVFIGTPARGLVSYVAVDGALFAAVFLSAPIALVQVGIVYGSLGASVLARAAGSSIPSPPMGWLLPLIVTLSGVLALLYLRAALCALADVLARREQANRERRRVLAEAAAEEARVRQLGTVEEVVLPGLTRLHRLADELATEATGRPAATREALWLSECLAEADRDLGRLRGAVAEVDLEPLEDALDTGILGASAARLLRPDISRDIDGSLSGLPLPPRAAEAVVGFVREALTNASLHGAAPIGVGARRDEAGLLEVWVADAGAGFDSEEVERGLGLDGLEDLARRAGGEVRHRRGRGRRGHRVELHLDPEGWA